MPQTLVIGVGNRDRGDDAAGLDVVRRLRPNLLPADTVVLEQEGPASDLMEAWRGAERVIVVDAAVGALPGSVRRFEAHRQPLPSSLLRTSTHSWGVAEAVETARALGELPRSLVVYAVFGGDFETGARRLSPEVAAATRRLARALVKELARP